MAFWNYKLLEVPGATIIFPEGYESEAAEVAYVFERVREKVVSVVGNDPGMVTVVLKYSGSYVNGSADPVTNTITVLMYPKPSVFLNFQNWYETVLLHEFTHIAHLNYSTGLPGLVKWFTGLPLLNPQYRSPFVEATTIYSESKFTDSGRLNNPVIEDFVYSKSKEKFFSLLRVSSPPVEDFLPGYSYYNVPAHFYSYLVEGYGIDKMKEFLKGYSDNVMGLWIEREFEKIYGMKMTEVFNQWKEKFHYKERKATVIYEKEKFFIRDVFYSEGKIYVVYKVCGEESVYDWSGYRLGVLSGNEIEEIKRLSGYAGYLYINKNTAYYLSFIKYKDSSTFPHMKTAVVKLDLESKKDSILVEGYVSAFSVHGDVLVYSEYDPKGFVSTVKTTDGKVTANVHGLVRELAYDGKDLAILYSERDHSSFLMLINPDGKKLLNDSRFKYSLHLKDGEVYFVGFENGSADLFYWDKRSLFKLTEGQRFLKALFTDEGVLGLDFSGDFPSTRVIRVETSREKFPAKIFRIVEEKELYSNYEIRDAKGYYLLKTLIPVVHVPFAYPDGESWNFGIVLSGISPDYSFLWGVVPVISVHRTYDLFAFLNFSFGDLNLQFHRFPGFQSASVSWVFMRKWFSSDSRADFVFGGVWDGELLGYVSMKGYKGNASFYVSSGYGSKGVYVSGNFAYRTGKSLVRLSGQYYSGISGEIEYVLPLMFTDFGWMDPYFHLSHVYGSGGIGYDEDVYLLLGLGVELSTFLTYQRGFYRLLFKIYRDGFSVEFKNDF